LSSLPPPSSLPSRSGHASSRWDHAGIVASGLCVVHCVGLPLLVIALPGLGMAWLADESIHRWLLILLVFLALPAFASGYRHHRRLWVPACGVASLALLGFTAYGMDRVAPGGPERALTVAGSLVLIASHAVNLWLARSCLPRPPAPGQHRGESG
jgi:MerC mercury resistance protein